MDRLNMLLPLAWRNLWRNPRRTWVTLAVVSVGLYSVLVLGALLEAWAISSLNTNLNLLTGSGQVHAQGYLDDPTVSHRMPQPNEAMVKILNRPDVTGWVKRVGVSAVIRSEYKTLPLTLMGVDPGGESKISTIPQQIADGNYLSTEDDPEIILGRHLAERLKTRIGNRVVIMAQSRDGSLAERAFQVKGLFAGNQNLEDAYAFTGINTAQAMLDIGDDISEISFKVKEDKALRPVIDKLAQAAPAYDVASWKTLSPMTQSMNVLMHGMVYIWLLVMCTFMAIGIVNTQLMAVFERVREFGLLQALGMQPRLILFQVLLESALLIGIGVLAGMAASGMTIVAFHNGVDLGFMAQGAEYWGAGHIIYPQLSTVQFAGLSFTVWILGISVTLWPARRASHSNPVEAMHYV